MTTGPFHIRFAVIGLTGAGATTLISAVSEINELQNRGRTSPMPQIRLALLPRSRAQWEIVLTNKAGIIVVVDSTRPDTFDDTRAIMEELRLYASPPFVILANKQDHPDALDAEQIRARLHAGPDVMILPCVARRPSSIIAVMRELIGWAAEKK